MGPVSAPSAARYNVKHLGAQQTFRLDGGVCRLPHSDVLVDGEVHQHLRPVEFDARHSARWKSRHLDVGSGEKATCVGEVRGVRLALTDEGKTLVLQRRDDDRGDHGDADSTDHQRVALGEGLHFGVHRPETWPATFTYTG